MPRIGLQDERGFNQIFPPVGTTPFRASRRYGWFINEAKRIGARRILELGCGTGEASASVAAGVAAEVVAVDISNNFLARASARHVLSNLRFEKLDLLSDDLRRIGRFDMVFGNGILHHLVLRLSDVLRTLHSLTNQGGGLAFIEPNVLNPYCAFIFGTGIGRRIRQARARRNGVHPGPVAQGPTGGWLAGRDGDDQGLLVAGSAGGRRTPHPCDRASARGHRGDAVARAIAFYLGKVLSLAAERRRR